VRRAIAGLVLLAVATACGVPLDSHASATDAADVPYGLVANSTSTTVTANGPTPVTVFLVADNRLVPVTRRVSGPLDAAEALRELASPLTPEETADGLRRAFGDTDLLGAVERNGAEVAVELLAGFDRLPSREQVLSLGQIVYTLTGLPGIERVRFTRDGEPLDVPTADATLTSGPLGRAEYGELLGTSSSTAS
jgi:spore germination protein GerM